MFSHRHPSRSGRRATVLVMVVGVLAMLFIIGSTLLMVARFDRQTADVKQQTANMKSAGNDVVLPVLTQLREDMVGNDGEPYNRGWSLDETSDVEDFGDFAGYLTAGQVNPGTPITPAVSQARARNGDLLLSSIAPFREGSKWRWSWTSWALDGIAPMDINAVYPGVNSFLTALGGPVLPNNAGDADGDGLIDCAPSIVMSSLTGVFGNSYRVQLRVVPHGGMVLIDQYTHPSLLAQVVHPEDEQDPRDLWTDNPAMIVDSIADEGALRRRFMLPRQNNQGNPSSMDMKLMVTLGYKPPSRAPQSIKSVTPHWWMPDENVLAVDGNWWQVRLTPGSGVTDITAGTTGRARTEQGYNASTDSYDRRHLVTVNSSDDLLRRQREESRLNRITDASGPVFLNAIAPDASFATPGNYYGAGRFPYGLDLKLDGGGLPDPDTRQLVFNTAGLRTQFSLRDALVDPAVYGQNTGGPVPAGGYGSYARLMQLTAYYLAMIQHTNVPGSSKSNVAPPNGPSDDDLYEQLKIAAQLAVNTFDYGDLDSVPTDFAWSGTVGSIPRTIRVVGVERQPYITEAYAKIIFKPEPPTGPGDATTWEMRPAGVTTLQQGAPDLGVPESIYAVELYNPYDVPLHLKDYNLVTTETTVDLASQLSGNPPDPIINPWSYVVIANTDKDVSRGGAQFITGATVGQNLFVTSASSLLEIPPNGGVILQRKGVLEVKADTPATQAGTWIASTTVDVDRLEPGQDNNLNSWTGSNRPITFAKWPYDQAGGQTVGEDASCPSNMVRKPGHNLAGGSLGIDPDDDFLVRDSSLQRHKEAPGQAPVFWHATLARQWLFPFAEDEVRLPGGPPPKCEAVLTDYGVASLTNARPYQHNLLGWNPATGWAGNQLWVENEFAGIRLVQTPNGVDLTDTWWAGRTTSGANEVALKPPIAGFPVVLGPVVPESAHPVTSTGLWWIPLAKRTNVQLTFDNDTDASGIEVLNDVGQVVGSGGPNTTVPVPNTTAVGIQVRNPSSTYGFGITSLFGQGVPLAFPTTGSLLLVTRYAQRPADSQTASTAAVLVPPGSGRALLLTAPSGDPGQLQMLDNGHMPIFDAQQVCTDVQDRSADNTLQNHEKPPQGGLNVPWGQLVFDYFTALPLEELVAARDFSVAPFNISGGNGLRLVDLPAFAQQTLQTYSGAYHELFPDYPMIDLVTTPGSMGIGAKVRGRINVNFAPWWVLDGLPMVGSKVLPNELDYTRLDPAVYTNMRYRPGTLFSRVSTDETTQLQTALNTAYGSAPAVVTNTGSPPLELTSASPTLARAIVGYRENRPVDTLTLASNSPGDHDPGFLTPGSLVEALARLPLRQVTSPISNLPIDNQTLDNLRSYGEPSGNPTDRPFAYLNYLQLVAPVVRLQDWVTVKDHVFTVYSLIGTTAQPQVWLRSQVTVDRTRCLYSNDLPARITEQEPIGYFNASGD